MDIHNFKFISVYGLKEVGGFESLQDRFLGAAANYTIQDHDLYGNRSCGYPPKDSLHLFRPMDDGSFPWPGMIVGLTILGTSAWCTEQVHPNNLFCI